MAEDVFGIVGSVVASTYHVENVVSDAGLGVVYRARHVDVGAPVALKLLRLPAHSPERDQAFYRRFRDEGEHWVRFAETRPTLARALRVAALTREDGRHVPYLALEWLDGMTLAKLVAERTEAGLPPIALRKLARLLTPVARALEDAHEFVAPDGRVSLVHGDVRSEKIFIAQVEGEEVVKLLDIGIGQLRELELQVATELARDPSAPTRVTAAGKAPEQRDPRHGPIGPWTDVWGLALCLVEVMLGRRVVDGDRDPAKIPRPARATARSPTPRSQGIAVPDAVEEVFARALASDPKARQKHAGVFWNELLAALAEPAPPSVPSRQIELVDDLEFDPLSARKIAASAPQLPSATARGTRPHAQVAPVTTQARATIASAAHVVPDLELTPPPVSRRASGEHPISTLAPNSIELDSALPAAMDLELQLDLPAEGPRAPHGPSSQRLPATRSSSMQELPRVQGDGLPQDHPLVPTSVRGEPLAGSPTSGVISTRNAERELNFAEPPHALGPSRPPPSADVSAPFEASFVAKIEPPLREERSLLRRLRPALALLTAAIAVAIFDPLYAATNGAVLEILGQRLSRFAAVLLLLALVLAGREALRDQ